MTSAVNVAFNLNTTNKNLIILIFPESQCKNWYQVFGQCKDNSKTRELVFTGSVDKDKTAQNMQCVLYILDVRSNWVNLFPNKKF